MFGSILGAIAGPLIGGLLGGGESKQTQSTQQTLDPRMEAAIYGQGGLLGGAQDWYSQNRAGLNSQMLTGLNNQWNQHAASSQGFNQMQQLGMGLMGGGTAGNPFTGGDRIHYQMPQQQSQQQSYQAPQAPMYQPAAPAAASNPITSQFVAPSPVSTPMAAPAETFEQWLAKNQSGYGEGYSGYREGYSGS